jgi:hypothetical protein
MKRSLLFLFILSICIQSSSQLIKGIILDSDTKKPIPFAVAYFDGTSIATYADEKGSFKLDARNIHSMPLVFSALGYFSTKVVDYSPLKEISVYLTPKTFELSEVAVETKGNPKIRIRNLATFRTEFLGRTRNAEGCEILNEDDIRFTSSSDRDTLRAYTLKPIIISNKKLGYRITYYLNQFEYINSLYLNHVVGTSFFEEDTSSYVRNYNYVANRDSAYYGSKMHFIRSLWQDDLKTGDYKIKNQKKDLSYNELVRVQLSTDPNKLKKYIFYDQPKPVLLSIKWKKTESGLELLRNNIVFERNGFYYGPGIIWHGEMAKQGVADLLPYDYLPSR